MPPLSSLETLTTMNKTQWIGKPRRNGPSMKIRRCLHRRILKVRNLSTKNNTPRRMLKIRKFCITFKIKSIRLRKMWTRVNLDLNLHKLRLWISKTTSLLSKQIWLLSQLQLSRKFKKRSRKKSQLFRTAPSKK